MANRSRVKITVIKKLSSKEVYGGPLPEIGEDMTPYCDRLQEGQEFIVDESGAMPSGFCTWAWHDVYPAVTGLRFGGNYPWMKKEGMIYSCCSDGARPVFFRIERL
ncbi:MAG TPA: TIGR04076 family protein [Thermodesulfobacteriota bacterium]|nr:TIGR04076 family protein [Thermodesulfobacteriota bacterium]